MTGKRENMPQFSIVTACLNRSRTIADAMRSVRSQTGVSVEHIVKDGGSSDRTAEIAAEVNPDARIIVGPDSGLYDAMNRGFEHCRGEIVGFLNSDDYYAAPDVLQSVWQAFQETGCEMVYGDIALIDSADRVVRQWRCSPLRGRSLNGQQLPHPSFFVRRDVLERMGKPFDPSYRISADLKQQLILIEKLGCRAQYVPRVLAIMRIGGVSTRNLGAHVRGWIECARAYREVHRRSGWLFVLRKVLVKLPQVRVSRRPTGSRVS